MKWPAMLCLLTAIPVAVGAQPRSTEKAAVQPATVPRIPDSLSRRYSAFHSKLQPTAAAWIAQQAHGQAQKNAPDLPTLEAAIHQRFAYSRNLNDLDIEALAFLVLMDAAKSAQEDLKTMMEEMNAINHAKAQMRSLMDKINQESVSYRGQASAPCLTPLCRSLSLQASQLNTATAGLRRPVRLQVPSNPTYKQLQSVRDDLKNQLDSMSEMGEEESLRLQMAMDRMSKLMQTLSNIEKKISDTSQGIVQNLK